MIRRLLLVIMVALTLMATMPVAAQDQMLYQVITAAANVRAAPRGQIIGQLAYGARFYASGQDGDWITFAFWGRAAWIHSSTVQPVGASSLTQGTIRLMDYTLLPAIPAPGQPFNVNLQLQTDHDLGLFTVAGDCGQFVMAVVPFLPATGSQIVTLACPGESATGPHDLTIVLDLDRQVSNGSSATIHYFVDHPYQARGTIQIPAYSNVDLFGGSADLSWDGVTLTAYGAAILSPLSEGTRFSDLHFDMLAALITGPVTPRAGALLGIITAEGYRGILRIVEVAGNLILDFLIYG